ncbi:MAG: Nif3-like dinuclear metal center hexameric protein [Propioniciclava sp.]
MITVGEVAAWFEEAYPPDLAEDWDQVGLSVGDPQAAVERILFAVEVTDAVVTEALIMGADLIVAHHPLLLRGIHTVRADQPKGRIITRLITAGAAVFSAHTNADAAADGVADALADVLELTDRRPLVAKPGGAQDASSALGLGRVGMLPTPTRATDLAARLAERLPPTAGGIRIGGDPVRSLERVAVLGGAGDSLLDAARAAGVDAYVTGDLRHHPAQDFLAHDDAPVLIDVPHWAAEWVWLPNAERLARERAAATGVTLTTAVSRLNTDPWALRLDAPDAPV